MDKRTLTNIVDVAGASLVSALVTFLLFIALVSVFGVQMGGIGPWICIAAAGIIGHVTGLLVLRIFKTPAFARKPVVASPTQKDSV